MLDIVSGTAKRDDFLARLKVGKVLLHIFWQGTATYILAFYCGTGS
jgi:hypothetical protein